MSLTTINNLQWCNAIRNRPLLWGPVAGRVPLLCVLVCLCACLCLLVCCPVCYPVCCPVCLRGATPQREPKVKRTRRTHHLHHIFAARFGRGFSAPPIGRPTPPLNNINPFAFAFHSLARVSPKRLKDLHASCPHFSIHTLASNTAARSSLARVRPNTF